ncbi:4-oxalocrotonate tautomerase [Bacillus sp. FJAT-27251]|uniref:4-oxalocrotonate tautomerase n=1 Tax=Bacillus sp. FJAT-27251 TaxID=1684142 RepID=UPI0006A795F9|nr:4-oxalocrotonate tautomerase [Bacillus sp. FJAT-27251]
MPIINIQIFEGRSGEIIEKLIEDVTATVGETLNAPKENIRVIVTEVKKTHWGIGGRSAEQLGR